MTLPDSRFMGHFFCMTISCGELHPMMNWPLQSEVLSVNPKLPAACTGQFVGLTSSPVNRHD